MTPDWLTAWATLALVIVTAYGLRGPKNPKD
jgi:hypothetical protein